MSTSNLTDSISAGTSFQNIAPDSSLSSASSRSTNTETSLNGSTGEASNPTSFNPQQSPLPAAQPSVVNPSQGSNTNAKPNSKEKLPGLGTAEKTKAEMENMIKQYELAKEQGLETAAADIIYRIVILAGQLAIFGATIALSAVTCGAATPLAVWAGLGVAVSAADLGFSVGNVALRAAGKDSFTYHGDSISNILEAILRKGGMTDEAKIDKITNYVSSGMRMGLGSLTLCANQLHRPGFIKEKSGPSCREYMDFRLPKSFTEDVKKMLKEQNEANQELNLTAEKKDEVPTPEPNPSVSEDEIPGTGPGNPPSSTPPAPDLNSGEQRDPHVREGSSSSSLPEDPSQGEPRGPQDGATGNGQLPANHSNTASTVKVDENQALKAKLQDIKAKMSASEIGGHDSKVSSTPESEQPEELSADLKQEAEMAIREGIFQASQEAAKEHPITCSQQALNDMNVAQHDALNGKALVA